MVRRFCAPLQGGWLMRYTRAYPLISATPTRSYARLSPKKSTSAAGAATHSDPGPESTTPDHSTDASVAFDTARLDEITPRPQVDLLSTKTVASPPGAGRKIRAKKTRGGTTTEVDPNGGEKLPLPAATATATTRKKTTKSPKALKAVQFQADISRYNRMAELLSLEFEPPAPTSETDIEQGKPTHDGPFTDSEMQRITNYLTASFKVTQLRDYIESKKDRIPNEGGLPTPPVTVLKALGRVSKARKTDLVDLIVDHIWQLRRSRDEIDRVLKERQTSHSRDLQVAPALADILVRKEIAPQIALRTLTQLKVVDIAEGRIQIEGGKAQVETACDAITLLGRHLHTTNLSLSLIESHPLRHDGRHLDRLIDWVAQITQTTIERQEESMRISALGTRDAIAAQRLFIDYLAKSAGCGLYLSETDPTTVDTPSSPAEYTLIPVANPFSDPSVSRQLALTRLQTVRELQGPTSKNQSPSAFSLEDQLIRSLETSSPISTDSELEPDSRTLHHLFKKWSTQLADLQQRIHPEVRLDISADIGQVCIDIPPASTSPELPSEQVTTSKESPLPLQQLQALNLSPSLPTFSNLAALSHQETWSLVQTLDQAVQWTHRGIYFSNVRNYPARLRLRYSHLSNQVSQVVAQWRPLPPYSSDAGAPGTESANKLALIEATFKTSSGIQRPLTVESVHRIYDTATAHILFPNLAFDLTLRARFSVAVTPTTTAAHNDPLWANIQRLADRSIYNINRFLEPEDFDLSFASVERLLTNQVGETSAEAAEDASQPSTPSGEVSDNPMDETLRDDNSGRFILTSLHAQGIRSADQDSHGAVHFRTERDLLTDATTENMEWQFVRRDATEALDSLDCMRFVSEAARYLS
ncbi:hypothetical protein H4R33_002202 [Dimargaris cristalligena]|nr:hypothetical protein H4R33_002202 [Dimargaris cristalligena]